MQTSEFRDDASAMTLIIQSSCLAKASTSAIACWMLWRRQSLGAFSSVSDKSSARRVAAALGGWPQHELRENLYDGRTDHEITERWWSSVTTITWLALEVMTMLLVVRPIGQSSLPRKKTPSTRKVSHGGATIANSPSPSRSDGRFKISPYRLTVKQRLPKCGTSVERVDRICEIKNEEPA